MLFLNRLQAGEKLGRELQGLQSGSALILAIPRGGAPVAAAAAKTLGLPFDIVPLIKIPIPWFPDASYGAVASDGTMALNQSLVHRLEVSVRELELTAAKFSLEAKRREVLYRGDRPGPDAAGRPVIIIDDGLGSGYSMLAAVQFVRKRTPEKIVVAAPVASEAAFGLVSAEAGADNIVVLTRDPSQFFKLAAHYKDFSRVTDDEVKRLLEGGTIRVPEEGT